MRRRTVKTTGRYLVAGRSLPGLGIALSYAQTRVTDGRSDLLDIDEAGNGTVARVWRDPATRAVLTEVQA